MSSPEPQDSGDAVPPLDSIQRPTVKVFAASMRRASALPERAAERCASGCGAGQRRRLAGIERGKLSITKGSDNLMIFGNEDGNDTRCKVCGSLLYSVVGAFVRVAMGTLVDEPTIRPTAHIFVGSKARWWKLTNTKSTWSSPDLPRP
jgi:hypothetical protein